MDASTHAGILPTASWKSAGWPAGNPVSFDVQISPQGVAQIIIEHVDTWPPTEWQVLLQRGLPATGIWTTPITVADPGESDETILKLGGAAVIREDNSEIIVVWPDSRNDGTYNLRTDLFTTRGR